MVDKLIVLSSQISQRYRELMLRDGLPGRGYKRYLDLRKTEYRLPVKLHYSGVWDGIHKADLVDVARLGLPRTKEILREIFSNLHSLKIYRIDLCVDLLGVSPQYFLAKCRIPRRQNIALYRSGNVISFYPVFGKEKKVVIYDRLALLKKQRDPLAEMFKSTDYLTRVEVRYTGAGVPFRRFSDIYKYADFNPFDGIKFEKLQIDSITYSPKQLLTAMGLRALISELGLQVASKRFAPEKWAYLEKTFLAPMDATELPPLKRLMRKSNEDWLEGRIRFPRSATREQE